MSTTATETQPCTKCGTEYPPDEFPKASSTYKLKDGTKRTRHYRLSYCFDCKRKQVNASAKTRRSSQPGYHTEWRKKNPELAKAKDDRYNRSEKGKAARRRYNRSPKGIRAYRRHARKKRMKERQERQMLAAALPAAVVRPYLSRMLREFQEPANNLAFGPGSHKGYDDLAELVGVHRDTLRHIDDGSRKQVTIEVADKLALHADFTLDELTDRAREWAMLTGDRWPKGYHGRAGISS